MQKLFALAALAFVADNLEGMMTWKERYKLDLSQTLQDLYNLEHLDAITQAGKELNDSAARLASKGRFLSNNSKTHSWKAAGYGLLTCGLTKATIKSFNLGISSNDIENTVIFTSASVVLGLLTLGSVMQTMHHGQKAAFKRYFIEGRLSRTERMQRALESNPLYERALASSARNSDTESDSE